jgi:hypothetical protein
VNAKPTRLVRVGLQNQTPLETTGQQILARQGNFAKWAAIAAHVLTERGRYA